LISFLHIRNIAVIDDLEVEFGPGLNVISGETGSGKSILVDAMGLLGGARAAAELIRSGESKALVEGVFQVPADGGVMAMLAEAGCDPEDAAEAVLVRRDLSAGSGGKISVCGRLVPAATLRRLGQELLEIHGQHDNRLLLQPRYHLELLDQFHGRGDLLAGVSDLARRFNELAAERETLQREERTRLQKLDLLEFQIREIEEVRPLPDEETRLLEERRLLANAEKLSQTSREAYDRLYEQEDSLHGGLSRLEQRLAALIEVDPRLARARESLQSCLVQVEDTAYFLRGYADSIEFSEERLDAVETRLAQFDRLKRKYGPTLGQVIAFHEDILAQREQLRHADERRAELDRQLDEIKAAYLESADALARVRREAAGRIQAEMCRHLGELDMPGLRFEVVFRPLAADGTLSPSGLDEVEFFASPNVGEELRPLQRIASGGELSRMTLALKLILRSEPNAVLIFDEIDAGIGGRTAAVVGHKLRGVAGANQTFCVTHSPQIAALADHHYRVEKVVRDGRTFTAIERLDGEARVDELARMLGGKTVSDIGREHARQLLARS